MRYSEIMEAYGRYRGSFDGYGPGRMGQGERDAFKRQELEHELRHEDEANRRQQAAYRPYQPAYRPSAPSMDSPIKMTHLHYFPMTDADARDFAAMKVKQDRRGRWYLPQYNKSGATFQNNFQTLSRTFGAPQSVALK